MKDRIPSPGQEGRVLISPEGGGVPCYAKITMADNPIQMGTPNNKGNLLSDATEIKIFGDAADRTVNQALSAVSNWRKIQEYNTAGTYEFTVPEGCYKLGVFLLGGGGSGPAVAYTGDNFAHVVAGASGQLVQFVMDVIPGQVIPAVVGAGGAARFAGTPNPAVVNGLPGGSSSFGGSVAVGGEGGVGLTNSTNIGVPGAIGGQCSESSRWKCGDPPYGCVHTYTLGGTSSSENSYRMTAPNLSRVPVNRFDLSDTHIYCGAGATEDKAIIRSKGRAGICVAQSSSTPSPVNNLVALDAVAPGDGGGYSLNKMTTAGITAVSGSGADGLIMLYWGGM